MKTIIKLIEGHIKALKALQEISPSDFNRGQITGLESALGLLLIEEPAEREIGEDGGTES